MAINSILALLCISFTLFLFATVVTQELGGNEALFAILGYVAAWAEMIVIFYFRKAPAKGEVK